MKFLTEAFLIIFCFLITFNFVNCSDLSKKSDIELNPLLVAKINYSSELGGGCENILKVLEDSTYVLSLIDKQDAKIIEFKGRIKINNDTLEFINDSIYNLPVIHDSFYVKSAVLKNGYIEFIDGHPKKMKIEKTVLDVKNKINTNSFPDYAIFTFDNHIRKYYPQNDYSMYDLNNLELIKIDKLLKREFSRNNKLHDFNDYLKQIIAVTNSQNDILIKVKLYCKMNDLSQSFQYFLIVAVGGGYCNFEIELNLTKEEIKYDYIG